MTRRIAGRALPRRGGKWEKAPGVDALHEGDHRGGYDAPLKYLCRAALNILRGRGGRIMAISTPTGASGQLATFWPPPPLGQ